ncbi:MAG TPA: DUF3224 domain-containing protein [Pseudonocardiaceae bacterium]|nr:DUF3224 domain-containing protein [Pseudonocardiaceae bacterium]
MTTRITGEYDTLDWKEQTYAEIDDTRKLSDVTANGTFTGGIEATSTVAYLLAYRPTGCDFVGYENVTGALDGRKGTFVLQHNGRTEGKGLVADCVIVPESGTGELTGLRGTGRYVWTGEEGVKAKLELDYEL